MSDYGLLGVDAERKEHPAIKSGKKELGDAPSKLNAYKIDGQRLYKGPGSGGMGGTKRTQVTNPSLTVNRTSPGSFRVRKRTLKG